MKKRLGFISNSSSSSFVCDCGSVIDTSDMSMEDVGIERCENGHYFCNNCHSHSDPNNHYIHVNPENDDDFMSRILKKEYCPYCQFEQITDTDLKNFLLRKYDTSTEKLLKEIKSIFKTYEAFRKYLYRY